MNKKQSITIDISNTGSVRYGLANINKISVENYSLEVLFPYYSYPSRCAAAKKTTPKN